MSAGWGAQQPGWAPPGSAAPDVYSSSVAGPSGMHQRSGAGAGVPGGFVPQPGPAPAMGQGYGWVPSGYPAPNAAAAPPAQAFGAPQPMKPQPAAFPVTPPINDATQQIATAIGMSYGEKMMQWGRNRVGLLTGDSFFYLFHIDQAYVARKLVRLFFPWTVTDWVRKEDRGGSGEHYQPPKRDLNAPDLYIPMCSLALLVTIHAVQQALSGAFTPATVNSDVSWLALVWVVQYGLFYSLLRLGAPEDHAHGAGYLQAGNQPRTVPVRHTELLAYAGYLFTFAVVPSLVSSLGSWVMWLAVITYCWVALARFTLKALEALKMTAHQQNSQAQNYAMFVGLLVEFVVLWFVATKPVLAWSHSPASSLRATPATRT